MNTTFTELGAALFKGHSSDIGKRPNQEDRYLIAEYMTADGRPATLALVADGIGGHNTGERASQMAKEMIPDLLLKDPPSASETNRRLKAALEQTGQAIYADSLTAPERAGMGTTCTAVCIIDRRLYLAHAGDSRAYLLRGGQLHQLTIDHTWAEEAIRAGRSPDEIRTHPNRGVIMRYLGIDPNIIIDTRYKTPGNLEPVDGLVSGPFFLEPGDTLLLSTDGVTDSLEPIFLAERMAEADCQEGATKLVQAALAAGATDNVTAVIVRLPGGAVIAPKPVAAATAAGKRNLVPIIAGAVGLLAVAVVAIFLLTRGGGGAPAVATTAVSPATVTAPETGSTRVAQAATRPPSSGGGGVEVATAAPTEPGAAVPTLAAITSPVTTTESISGTTTGAAPSGEPTLIPTFTPDLPPTRPPATPTRPERTPAAGAAPTPARPSGSGTESSGLGSGGVALLVPADGEKLTGSGTFEWRDQAGFSLRANELYELIIWGLNEDPMISGRSPVGASKQNKAEVNLTDLEGSLGLTDGATYKWGVRLYVGGAVKRMLSEPRTFAYARAGGGGNTDPGLITGGGGGDDEK